jgi:pimeloyl-ACP methyl ester carboxylesterase
VRRCWGDPDDPVAVLLPGAASTADFVTRAFGPPLAGAGLAVVSGDHWIGADPVREAFAMLDSAADRYRVRLVGGVSLGAQLAARWAATRPGRPDVRGMLLVLPAWTGAPSPVATASAAAADDVDRYGVAGALDRMPRSWVADELATAWPRHGPALAASLRAAARVAGPTPAELARIAVPVGLVAFADDPLHPAAVADEWARLLPRAAVERLTLADAAADRSVVGAAALAAWRHASGSSPADRDSNR